MNNKNIYKGIICIILSALSFAFMFLCINLAGDLPFYEKSFFRNSITLVVTSVILLKKRKNISVHKSDLKDLICRGLFGTLGLLCNFYAIDNMVLADASMLNKTSPFFAMIFGCVLSKEKITPTQLFVILVAFLGCFFVIRPSFTNIDYFPAIIGFIGGLGAGLAYAFVRKLGKNGVDGPVIVFAFSSISTLIVIPFLIFGFVPMTSKQLIILLLGGCFATAGQFLITAAYKYAPASKISIYDYSQIIFTALLGFLILNQVPDYLSIIGYIIILTAALVMFIYNNKRDHELSKSIV